jgi:hypothetical protein
MDHDTIDTMTVYRGDGKHPLWTSDTIDALDTAPKPKPLDLDSIIDCFSSFTLPRRYSTLNAVATSV